MKKIAESPQRKCPRCAAEEGQMKNGKNRSGSQTCLCRHCKKTYTLEPKQHAYSQEIREQAIRLYYSGVSGRGVGRLMGMSRYNVYRWIQKKPNGCG